METLVVDVSGFGKLSRIRTLETLILDNTSAGNLEELAELHFEQNYAKAREMLNRVMALRGILRSIIKEAWGKN